MFTKGVHKHDLTPPKFERRRDLARPQKTMQKTVAPAVLQKAFPKSSVDTLSSKNFGADIATLTGLIESGDL